MSIYHIEIQPLGDSLSGFDILHKRPTGSISQFGTAPAIDMAIAATDYPDIAGLFWKD